MKGMHVYSFYTRLCRKSRDNMMLVTGGEWELQKLSDVWFCEIPLLEISILEDIFLSFYASFKGQMVSWNVLRPTIFSQRGLYASFTTREGGIISFPQLSS